MQNRTSKTRKEKVTVTLTKRIIRELDLLAVARHANRSALIEEALEVWRREQLKQELADGYKAMADEDRKTAEQNIGGIVEILE